MSNVLERVFFFFCVVLAIAIVFLPIVIAFYRKAVNKFTVFLCWFFFPATGGITWLIALYLACTGATKEDLAKREELILDDLADKIRAHNKKVIREAEDDLLKADELHSRTLMTDMAFESRKQRIAEDLEKDLCRVNPENREELRKFLGELNSAEEAFNKIMNSEQDEKSAAYAVGAIVAGTMLAGLFEKN